MESEDVDRFPIQSLLSRGMHETETCFRWMNRWMKVLEGQLNRLIVWREERLMDGWMVDRLIDGSFKKGRIDR